MNRKEYRRRINKSYHRFNRGEITKEEFEIRTDRHYEEFLAQEHLRNNKNRRIFKKLLLKAKNRYGLAKDRYYLKEINIQQYIWRRGLRIGQGLGLYDSRLVELGLGDRLLRTVARENFSWKSLKVEQEIFPPSLRSPDNIVTCPPENALAAQQTMYVFLELADHYNKNHVPSLASDWIIRDPSWVVINEEIDAYSVPPYLEINVTPAERRKFERWRDGLGPPV